MQGIADEFLSKIGKNVKKIRKDKGLSMEELGLEIGLTRMQVHRIEKGYNITMTTLLKLSLALEAKPSDLTKFNYIAKEEDLEWLVNNNKSSRKKK